MHHPEDFPLVRDRGFVIGPGQEVFVGVDGADVYSTLDAKTVSAIKRKCYFRQGYIYSAFQSFPVDLHFML